MTQYLTFSLGGHEVALPLLEVRQIIEHVPPTFVPRLPASIRGVINLRGALVPVVDLASRFGMPAPTPTRTTCIIVVDAEVTGLLGLVVDEVHDVVEIDDVLPVPEFGTTWRRDDLLGVAELKGKLLLLLDSAKVLSAQELLAAAPVAAA
jgi:purine-binding chemotaxis protein CheW